VPGADGLRLKESLRSQSKSNRTNLANQVAGQFFPGFRVRKAEMVDIDTPGGDFALDLTLYQRGLLEKSNGTLLLPPIVRPSSMTRRFGGRPERKHPFVVPEYDTMEWDLTIDCGERRPAPLPEGVFIHRMVIDYAQSWSLDGNLLNVKRTLRVRPGRIPPERYPELLGLCRHIDDVEASRVRLIE
jgi:hypothetical protein